MPYFDDATEAYTYLAGVFREAAMHPEVGPKLAAAGITLQLRYSEPDCQKTVRLHDPIVVIEGETDETPDVILTLSADDADQYWRGELNLAVALAKGRAKSKGPVNKILKLVPLTKPMFPMYREMTAEKDRAGAAA
jgi:putative sterol carrier protein